MKTRPDGIHVFGLRLYLTDFDRFVDSCRSVGDGTVGLNERCTHLPPEGAALQSGVKADVGGGEDRIRTLHISYTYILLMVECFQN